MTYNYSSPGNLKAALQTSMPIRLSSIPLGIHLILWWLFYAMMIIRVEFFGYHAAEASLAYWSWLWLAAVMTAMINHIVMFKREFGYHVIMSVPRQAFTGYYVQVMVHFCILSSLLILLDLQVLRFLNHAYGFQEVDFLSVVYGSLTDHWINQFLIVFSILMLFSTLGAFIGSSTYRFGTGFIWGFWSSVGLGFSILVAVSEGLGFREEIIRGLLWFSGAGPEGSALSGSGHFLLISAALTAITYRNIKRMQLK